MGWANSFPNGRHSAERITVAALAKCIRRNQCAHVRASRRQGAWSMVLHARRGPLDGVSNRTPFPPLALSPRDNGMHAGGKSRGICEQEERRNFGSSELQNFRTCERPI